MPPKTRPNKHINESAVSNIPDGTAPEVWDMLLSIKKDTSDTRARVQNLEDRVQALESINSEWRETQTEIDELKTSVELLKAKFTKTNNTVAHLTNELQSMKAHTMKNNLIFKIDKDVEEYKEIKGENCAQLIRSFLKNVMGLSDTAKALDIAVAHRIGARRPGHTRPILVKFLHDSDIQIIMSNVSRLRETQHFITRQLPPSHKERKDFVLPFFKTLRSNADNKAQLVGDKLYVKGKLQQQLLSPVIPDIDPSSEITISESEEVTDNGSIFKGYAACVSSIDEVAKVISTLKAKPSIAEADHFMFAYRFSTKKNKIQENFDSDGDWGIGLEILRSMQEKENVNCISVVTRCCLPNFQHIGRKRFEHAKSLSSAALDQLEL